MKLALTEDQVLIRDSAEKALAAFSDSTAVRRAMETERGGDNGVWRIIAQELLWCGIAIGEAHGGLGLGPVELALIQEQAGRRLLCAPFFGTVCVAASALQEYGSAAAREHFLPEIAAGRTRIAISLSALRGAMPAVRARRDGASWMLEAEATQLLDAHIADWLFVSARIDDRDEGVFAVAADAPGVELRTRRTWDATRRFADVRLANVKAAMRLDDPARMSEGSVRALALSRLYLAAEQLGGAQQCLDLSIAHAMNRKQFGRVIAGFQAVKHRCAEMMVKIEALRSAVYGAAALAGGHAETNALARECAMARVLATDTFFWCAQEAIQLHGGVGFTWEYDPQLYFKRAQASSHWLGTAEEMREEVASAVLSPLPFTGEDGPTGPGEGSKDPFRAEVAAWMREHLSGRFAALKHRGGPGDEEFEPELRKQWERELARGGWTCVGWPRECGGRGLSIEQQVVFHEEYARAGGPGRMGHIGEGLIGPALIQFGSAALQGRFLPRIVDGTEYWAQGYSEPNAGSDLANVQTRCWREADGSWRVQGQKIWTSLAHESDWIFVLARSEPGSKGGKGLSFLLLPLKQPGIAVRPIRQMSGGAEFNEVFFDGARAENEHLVGAPGEGWKVAMGVLEAERGVSTLGQQMHFAYELDLIIAAARRRGLDGDPHIRQRIAQAWCGLRTMRYNALRMLSEGESMGLKREALIYKYHWSNWHRDLGKLAADVLGEEADVISDDPEIRPLQQLFFFSRADTIYAGSNEIQLNLIAERGLVMPRELRPSDTPSATQDRPAT